MLVLLFALAPAAQADVITSPWGWVDRGPKLLDVSCGTPEQCVAVGAGGVVLRPAAEQRAGLAWSGVKLPDADPPLSLIAVSCRGARCVAISGAEGGAITTSVSQFFRSEDGGATWSAGTNLPPAASAPTGKRAASDIACDPNGVCVIVGPGGAIWRSTNDGRDFNDLKASSLGLPYRKVACPAGGVCVLTGAGKTSAVLRDSDATKETMPDGMTRATALACDSPSRCVAADGQGPVAFISAPWTSWSSDLGQLPIKYSLVSLACPARNTCVGLSGPGDFEGKALRTTRLGPKMTAEDWAKRPTATKNLQAIDCAATNCVAVGKIASRWRSADIGQNWAQSNGLAEFDGIDCPPGGEDCVGGGKNDIGVSTTAGDFWTIPLANAIGTDVNNVSCRVFPECLAFGESRTLATSDGGLHWINRAPASPERPGGKAFTCFAPDKCVGINDGIIYTTLDGARTPWAPGSIPTDPKEALSGIACPHEGLCVVAGADTIYRGVLSSTNPVQWDWTASDADPTKPLTAIACAPGNFCTAVGMDGNVLTTRDPELLDWTRQIIGPKSDPTPLKSVACPAENVCVAGGDRAYVATTTNGWKDYSLDQIGEDHTSAGPSITGFGCMRPTRCVAISKLTVFVGVRSTAPPPTRSRRGRGRRSCGRDCA